MTDTRERMRERQRAFHLSKIDTSTPEGFALRLEREYGVTIIRNRKAVDASSPGWEEQNGMFGGFAHNDGTVTFSYDPDKVVADDLLNYGLCHEVGHILDCRDEGPELYDWRYEVEKLEVEISAWKRADEIFFNIRGVVSAELAQQMADFKRFYLNSYEVGTATAEFQERVDALLERGTL